MYARARARARALVCVGHVRVGVLAGVGIVGRSLGWYCGTVCGLCLGCRCVRLCTDIWVQICHQLLHLDRSRRAHGAVARALAQHAQNDYAAAGVPPLALAYMCPHARTHARTHARARAHTEWLSDWLVSGSHVFSAE